MITRKSFFAALLGGVASAQRKASASPLIDWVRAVVQFADEAKSPSREDLQIQLILLAVDGAQRANRLKALAEHVATWVEGEVSAFTKGKL